MTEGPPSMPTADESLQPLPPIAFDPSWFVPVVGARALQRAVTQLADGRRITFYRDEPPQ